MISATDLRKGTCFEWDGQIYSVMDFQHNKHGRGSAVVWVKMRNIQTGASRENTFNPTDKFEQVSFEEKEMTYLVFCPWEVKSVLCSVPAGITAKSPACSRYVLCPINTLHLPSAI